MKTAVKVIVALLLVMLLIGVVVTAFRFLIGAAVIVGLIVLALAGVSKWVEGRQEHRLPAPGRLAILRADHAARKDLKRLEESLGDGEKSA